MNADNLLEVRHLKTQFSTDEGIAHAVEDVSFDLKRGETLGIVGESGSGKSVTMLSVMRLVTGKITDGEILFDGRNLRDLSDKEMIALRGKDITMVFQDPMTSLDPVYTIGYQLMEPILKHNKVSRREAFERAVEMLEKVGIANARERMKEYPHQLSGGMRQRVIIAMALTCNPKLLIADEPTTALDVTIQAQILDLMRQLKKDSDMSIILITHDLGVVAQMCDRVNVMYCGQIVESAPVKELYRNPRHKYTQGLLHSIPRLDQEAEKLDVIQGSVPSIVMLPTGCRFHPRCPYATAKRRAEAPVMVQTGAEHFAACHYALEEKEAEAQ